MNKRIMYGGNDYRAHEGKSGSVSGGVANFAQREVIFKSTMKKNKITKHVELS